MLKKLGTGLLALLVLAGVLVGCARGNGAAESGLPSEPASAPESAAPQSEPEKEVTSVKPTEPPKAVGYEYDRDALTYELVWSDEFDYEGAPDPEKWTYDIGAGGWGNNELQYYTMGDNVTVQDGHLVIELRHEDEGLYEYTSTRLITVGRGEWTYGKVEVSAKLPTGVGTWPAAWMMPAGSSYGGWPSSGEMDIMEHVGFDQDVIVHTVHTAAHHGGDGQGRSQKTAGVSEDFHTYALEWLPDRLIFSVDGEERYTYDPTKYEAAPTKDVWPFDQPFYLLLNLAYGGNWGGAQGTDDACLPARYEVDYVRVYQSPEIRALTEKEAP